MTATAPAPAFDRSTRSYARRRWILAVLCLSLLVIVVDNSILNVALPTLQRHLDATNGELQWMVDSYTLVFAGLLLTAGSLGDRYGRRGALQLGMIVFGGGSLLSAFASSPTQLIFTRGLMGIGGAFIMPSTLSLITNVFPPEERGRAISVWAAISGVGVALGPISGGFLLQHFYWGSVFLVNLPIVAIALVSGVFLLPTSRDPSKPELDPLGATLSMVALVALVYAIIQAPIDGWGSARILGAFAVAAVVLGAFALWEARTDHPMLDVAFFKNPRFTAASTGITLIFFAMFGTTFLLTQYLQYVMGYSALRAGEALLPWALVMLVVAPSSARLVERVGTKVVVGTGLSFAGLALALMATLPDASISYPRDVLWRMVLLAIGMGLTMAPATESIMGSLPRARAGVGSAVNDTTRQVGGALGVAVIGSVMTSAYGSRVGSAIAGAGLRVPHGVLAHAKQDLATALAIAGDKHALTTSIKSAFVGGMHHGVVFGAAAALVGAVVVAIWLPARGVDPDVGEVGVAAEADGSVEAAFAGGG